MEPLATTITSTVGGSYSNSSVSTVTLNKPSGVSSFVNYTGHTVAFYNGSTLISTKTITAATSTQISWSGNISLSTGNTYFIYNDAIESFVRLNGGNKDIVLSNLRGTAQRYRYPTVSYINLNSATDSGISFSGVADIYYDGTSAPNEKPGSNSITIVTGAGVGPTSALAFEGKSYNSKMRYLAKATLATGSQYSGSQIPFEGANFVTISNAGVVTDSAAMSIQQKPTLNADLAGTSAAIKATNRAYGTAANSGDNVAILAETGYEGTATTVPKTYAVWAKVNKPTTASKTITTAVGVEIEPQSGGSGIVGSMVGLRISGYNGVGTNKWAYQFADNASYSRNQGSVGIGSDVLTSAPTARLHVTEVTQGAPILKLDTVNGPSETTYHFKTTLTSVTMPQTLFTLPISNNTKYIVNMQVYGSDRTSTSAGYSNYHLVSGTVYNNAGTVGYQGTVNASTGIQIVQGVNNTAWSIGGITGTSNTFGYQINSGLYASLPTPYYIFVSLKLVAV